MIHLSPAIHLFLARSALCIHVAPPNHRHTAAAMEKLLLELAAEVTTRVTKAIEAPMEDLSSLRTSCSQMRRACGGTYVGRSIPLEPVL
jgi:hypothetical protein